MAIQHAKPSEVVNLLNEVEAAAGKTTTLIKTPRLEVIRMILPAGKKIPPHAVSTEVVVQCVEGKVIFEARGRQQTLGPQNLLYLEAGDEHALQALEHSIVLVTILLAG